MSVPQEFKEIMELENENLDLEGLWITYQWIKAQRVFPHYELAPGFVWDMNKIPRVKREKVTETLNKTFVYAGNDKLAKELVIYFRNLGINKKKDKCVQYIEIIENHLRPVLIDTGIYGIYEEDQLIYVGIAEQSFEKIEENVKKIFGENAYMKVLVNVGRLGSMKIDKRDLWAMKFAAIQILKPSMET